MAALDFLRTNLGRARRILLEPARAQRARNFIAWERHLAEERRRRRENQRRAYRRRDNQSLLQRELRQEASVLASHPTTLMIDPASVCNLRCPFCPTGANFGEFPRTVMTAESFSRIVGHLDPDLVQRVEFYNWGEPLLNPHLPDFIRFFSERHAETEVSTNFSQRDYGEDYLATLVASGLGTLIVSVDGARQETYERYRIKGNLARVLSNMRRLTAVKSELGSGRPAIVFKMLLNRYNQDEVEEARRLAAECGASFLLNEKFWCPDEARSEWVAGDAAMPSPIQAYTLEPEEVVSTYCRQLWESVIVAADGDVHPCCLTYEPVHAIGNLERQDLMSIRNSERAVYLRRFVTGRDVPAPAFANSCEHCTSRWCTVRRPSASA
jgi:radical SAM protein with 4Fe4S-binding SPASM domain